MWRAARLVAGKDLRLFLRDKVALLMSFALPIVLGTIFAGAMGGMGGSDEATRVELLVEDQDGSDASRALIAELERSKMLEVVPAEGARERVARGKSPAALLVPAGYGAGLAAGRTPRTVLYRDPAKAIEQQILAGSLMPALMRAAGPALGRAGMERGMDAMDVPPAIRDEVRRTFEQIHGDAGAATGSLEESMAAVGLETEDVTGGRAKEDGARKSAMQSHAISGIAVMMLLFGLVACGGTILEEEQGGTLQRVRLTPQAGAATLLGKTLFTVAVGLFQLVVLFAYGGLVFDLPVLQSPVALLVHSLAVALAAAGFGMLMAVTCRTRKQLEGLSTLLILTMSATGGSWFPLMITPEWFRTIGHFTLNAWAMDGYQAILWYGKGLGEILVPIAVLVGIAAVTGGLAWRGWRNRYEQPA